MRVDKVAAKIVGSQNYDAVKMLVAEAYMDFTSSILENDYLDGSFESILLKKNIEVPKAWKSTSGVNIETAIATSREAEFPGDAEREVLAELFNTDPGRVDVAGHQLLEAILDAKAEGYVLPENWELPDGEIDVALAIVESIEHYVFCLTG